MMLSIEPPLTFGFSLPISLIAYALSRAVTERAGGASLEPMAAASILAALDSIPTSKIKPVGGQDGLCKASSSSFGKSCPQPLRNNDFYGHVCLLEQVENGGAIRTPASGVAARTAASADDNPYTDRGVEFMETIE